MEETPKGWFITLIHVSTQGCSRAARGLGGGVVCGGGVGGWVGAGAHACEMDGRSVGLRAYMTRGFWVRVRPGCAAGEGCGRYFCMNTGTRTCA